MASLFLSGCGGGGSGGGGASLLSEWLGTDQNAAPYAGTDTAGVYIIGGKTYDLTHGAKDPQGLDYANLYNQGKINFTFPQSINLFGGVASSSTCLATSAGAAGCGPVILPPNADVISAWNQGWTGSGVNILILDFIGTRSDYGGKSYIDPHPAIVASLAGRYAIGSTVYGANYDTPTNLLTSEGISTSLPSPTKMGVINASYGTDLEEVIGRRNTSLNPWTTSELTNVRNAYLIGETNYVNSAFNTASGSNLLTSDAVISKSAGNDHIDAQYDLLSYVLSTNPSTSDRTLIVGATNAIGSSTARTSIASYSNVAGTNSAIQDRFLVASGQLPFDPTQVSYDGIPISTLWGNTSIQGTSFAAPRVAGYAAILRQKFPNLTAANTADILLATARYDTLTCYPNCDKTIYGRGEASLSHALSPVGYLR